MRSFKFTVPGLLTALILTACQVASTATPTPEALRQLKHLIHPNPPKVYWPQWPQTQP